MAGGGLGAGPYADPEGKNSKKEAAKRKYKGSESDWDNDKIPNTLDADPYNPKGTSSIDLGLGAPVGPKPPVSTSTWFDPNKPPPDPGAGLLAQAAEQERQAGVRHQQDTDRRNSYEDLYQRLLQIAGQGYSGPSYDEMQQRAQSIADAQYNPQIDLIRRQQTEAQGRAGRSKEELGGLYQALTSAYNSDVPQVQQLYQGAMDTQKQQQDALQSSIASDYQQRQDAINQLAQQYGQEQAGAEGLQPVQNDQTFITQLAQQIGQQGQQALGQQQANNVAYTQQGGRLAQAEGTNRQADVMSQLEDYMRQQEGNISGINAERQGTMASALAQMQNQQDQTRMQNEQSQWGRIMDLIGTRQGIDKTFSAPEGPSMADIIAGQRLGLDQKKAQQDYILEIAKATGLKGQELVDFINALTSGQTDKLRQ